LDECKTKTKKHMELKITSQKSMKLRANKTYVISADIFTLHPTLQYFEYNRVEHVTSLLSNKA